MLLGALDLKHLVKGRGIRNGLLLAVGVVNATPGSSQTPASQPSSPARWRAEVELTVGGANADDNATFGRISGLAVDGRGRIYVADAQDNQLRVFSPAGQFVARIGRTGSGPLEFKNLATIATGPNELLWVRDEGNARMLGIDVSATPARAMRNVPLKQFTGGSRLRPVFEPDGSIVDESIWFDKTIGVFRPIRLRRTMAGAISRADTIPVPAGATAGVHQITQVQKDAAGKEVGISQRHIWQPHGPQWLRAYGPAGVRADAVSSRYEVRIIDRNGALLHTISRTVPAVPLSPREKHKADSTIDKAGAALPFGVPASKAPILALIWTKDGQLWVERAVADGRPREADVFDAAGRLIGTAEWARDIDLASGFPVIEGRTVTVVAADPDGVERIVRLKFR